MVPSAWCSMRRRRTWTVPKTVLKVNGVVPRQMIPWPSLPCRWARIEFGVGLFDGVLEQAAFEHLAAAFDARFEAAWGGRHRARAWAVPGRVGPEG